MFSPETGSHFSGTCAGQEGLMPKCLFGRVPVAGLCATVASAVALGAGQVTTSRSAQAGDDCLTAPDRPIGPGGHWYYHLDRAHDRKCWYLVEPEARAPTADLPPPQPLAPPPAATPAPQPSGLETFFSSLSNGFSTQPASPQPAAPATYNTQSLRPNNADAATPQRPVHTTRRTDGEDAQAAKPPHAARPNPTQVNNPTQANGGAPTAPSEQSEHDALFQEFLRWRDHRQ
jgi:hypothetical protein